MKMALVLIAVMVTIVCAQYTPDGFTDLTQFLVPSEGSYALGNSMAKFNDTRDSGTKIVFFDRENGDNPSAGAYWWNGTQIVDSVGSPVDSEGREYGNDPLQPNEAAIKAFQFPLGLKRNTQGDPRLRAHKHMFGSAAAGYPDWYLFKRGQTHDYFDGQLDGGKSDSEPMVIAAYGPKEDGRAVIDPDGAIVQTFLGEERSSGWPFGAHTGSDPVIWFHQILQGLELHGKLGHLGSHTKETFSGTHPYWLIEDCKVIQSSMNYMPRNTIVRRSVSGFRWAPDHHNQGYYTATFKSGITFDEMIFYKNGYKTDPFKDPDPKRDIYSRNIYQGGGAKMGHTYRNIISADGASGGPQMRLGGTCENSLIIEGYWFSSTQSNHPENDWLAEDGQEGQSAVVRNNVQFLYGYPTPADPDTDDASDRRAQPFWGYSLQGASFNSVVEGNIISGALYAQDLGVQESSKGFGLRFVVDPATYQDGNSYTQMNNVMRNNIVYKAQSGFKTEGNWAGIEGNTVEGNVFVAQRAFDDRNSDTAPTTNQLNLTNNTFYLVDTMPTKTWVGLENTIQDYTSAQELEGWSDPDRTLKRYVVEVLGLTPLDWSDDPWLDPAQMAVRISNGESYDPMGLKTFMAVAFNMRDGGSEKAPVSGKPSWLGDYVWDTRYTAAAVVSWVREGFGLPSVMDSVLKAPDSTGIVDQNDTPSSESSSEVLLSISSSSSETVVHLSSSSLSSSSSKYPPKDGDAGGDISPLAVNVPVEKLHGVVQLSEMRKLVSSIETGYLTVFQLDGSVLFKSDVTKGAPLKSLVHLYDSRMVYWELITGME
ncbi:MAG: hypothetical protein OCC49_16530 [Fibrobacterales bacterium]